MAGALAAMFIFIFLIFSFFMMLIIGASSSKPERPDAVVLSMDLNMELSDQAPSGGFAALSGSPGFIDLLTRLKAAEDDESVKGLFIRGAFIGTGSSRAEELRQAIHSFSHSLWRRRRTERLEAVGKGILGGTDAGAHVAHCWD